MGFFHSLNYECGCLYTYGMLGYQKAKEDAQLANATFHNGFAKACALIGKEGEKLYKDFLAAPEE